MGLFNKKKKQETNENAAPKGNDELKADISKAYDELISGSGEKEVTEEAPKVSEGFNPDMELLKMKIADFKDKKSQEALFEVLKLLPKKLFILPAVSNMKEPMENVGGQMKLKQGAELNPALLTSQDKKLFLPIFTDEKAMTQKSPAGIVLKLSFEQCLTVVMNEQNPVEAIVINPFSENMILGNDLLKQAFKKVEKR